MDSSARTGLVALLLVLCAATVALIVVVTLRTSAPSPAPLPPTPEPAAVPSLGPGLSLEGLGITLPRLTGGGLGSGLSTTFGVLLLVNLIPLVLTAAWLARDAVSRGHDGATWTLVFLAPQFAAMLQPATALLGGSPW